MAETLFTVCNSSILPGWILLIVAPRWKWTHALIVTSCCPCLMGLVYIALLASNTRFAGRRIQRSCPTSPGCSTTRTACWRAGCTTWPSTCSSAAGRFATAQRVGVPHWLVVPCLILTFLLGPSGLVCYFAVR